MENYVFDNSFEGFLSLIFDYYVRKPKTIKVFTEKDFQESMFDETHYVFTDLEKAKRVHKSLQDKLSKINYKAIQGVFLSEKKEAYQHLFNYCCLVINHPNIQNNYVNEHVLYVKQMYRSVHREKHHHEAFIRFEQVNSDLFFAKTEPKYNILPLIINHFAKRYQDQNWLIYDMIRKYGILYNKDNREVQEVKLNFTPTTTTNPAQYVDVNEQFYQELWKSYFNSTTIKARKNSRLQIQMMPKRFWKYLTEYN